MQHAVYPIWIIPALAGMAIPVILVPAALLFKRARLNRHLTHKERMEAIRMGVTPPSHPSLPGPGSLVAIGAGVPIAAVVGALLTTLAVLRPSYRAPEISMLSYHDPEFISLSIVIAWSAALLISALALVTSLVLGVLQHRARARADKLERETSSSTSAKPAHDPDAFDLTGRHAY